MFYKLKAIVVFLRCISNILLLRNFGNISYRNQFWKMTPYVSLCSLVFVTIPESTFHMIRMIYININIYYTYASIGRQTINSLTNNISKVRMWFMTMTKGFWKTVKWKCEKMNVLGRNRPYNPATASLNLVWGSWLLGKFWHICQVWKSRYFTWHGLFQVPQLGLLPSNGTYVDGSSQNGMGKQSK